MFNEATLRRLYLEEQKSIRAVALLANVSPRTVFDALNRYRIPRRPAGFRGAAIPSASSTLMQEASLRHLYIEEEHSIAEIAHIAGVSTRTVFDALNRYRIPRRPIGSHKKRTTVGVLGNGVFDEEALRHMYEEEGLSIADIAGMTQLSPSCIRNALVRWQIPRRRRGRPVAEAKAFL